jgi:hypothetical protein
VIALAALGLARGRGRVRRFVLIALSVLIAAYALRHDLWHRNPDLDMTPTFNLRYRAPLIPLLFLCASMAATSWRWPVLLTLAGFGFVQRAALWDPDRGDQLDRVVYAHDGTIDLTLPIGDPPQRWNKKQGRPQDVLAALAAIDDHEDPFLACRHHHLHELGRRVGIGLSDGLIDGELALMARAVARDHEEELVFGEGVAKRLVGEEGDLVLPLESVPTPLWDAVGRRGHRGLPLDLPGVCEARGEAWVGARSELGAWEPEARELDPEGCSSSAFSAGVGRGWARYVGCGEADGRDLEAQAGAVARDAWHAACATLRVPVVSPG